MPYQHYLPATYLSNFANEVREPRRNSTIYVGDKKTKNIRLDITGRVCGENDFYEFPDPFTDFSIDKLWEYEGSLYDAIQKLINHQVDADTWVTTLIPFVTCLFVRGKDFKERFSNRIKRMGVGSERIFVNHARIFEIQRLLAPIITAEWIVLQIKGAENLIINDTGFLPFFNPIPESQGFAIPLDKRNILVLAERKHGVLLERKDGIWYPLIQYMNLPCDFHLSFNEIMDKYANRFIFGDTQESVSRFLTSEKGSLLGLEPFHMFKFSGRELAAFEFSWHRLVSFLDSYNKNEKSHDFEMNFEAISKYWKIGLVFPINLVEFPCIFHREQDEISFDCYDPEQYFIYSSIHNILRSNNYTDLEKQSARLLRKIKDKEFNKMAFFMRQNALLELRKPLKSFLELTLRRDKDSDYYFYRGVCFTDFHLHKLALKNYSEACRLNPDNENALLNLAVCLISLQKRESAKAILYQILSSTNEMVSSLAYLNLGNLFHDENNYKESVNLYQKVNTKYLSPEEKINFYNSLTSAYFGLKNYKMAVKFINEIEKIDQNNIYLYIRRMELAHINNDSKRFLEYSEKVLKITHQRKIIEQIHTQRSTAFLNQGNIQLALNELNKSIRKNVLNYQNHGMKANILLMIDKNVASIFENILVLLLASKDGRVFNSLGVNFLYMKRIECAIILFKKAIKLLNGDEEIIRPYRNLARCYLEMDNIEEAEMYIDLLKNLSPDSYETKVVLAFYFFKTGKFGEAINILQNIKGNAKEKIEVYVLEMLIYKLSDNNASFEKLNKKISKMEIPKIIRNRYQKELLQNNIIL